MKWRDCTCTATLRVRLIVDCTVESRWLEQVGALAEASSIAQQSVCDFELFVNSTVAVRVRVLKKKKKSNFTAHTGERLEFQRYLFASEW